MADCNYCTYQWLLRYAAERGEVITKIGENYYRHKPEVNIQAYGERAREAFFAAWFMELPTGCRC